VFGTRVTEFGMLLVINVATTYLGISRARQRQPAVGQVPTGVAAGRKSPGVVPDAPVSTGPVSTGPVSTGPMRRA